MAVEIKELVIRAVVQDDQEPQLAGDADWTAERQEALVRRAVDEVLRILKEAKER